MAPLMASSYNSDYRLISHGDTFNQASSCGFDNPQLSSKKAHRVDMLKSRFADIISKAELTLNDNGKINQTRMQHGNEDFMEMQQEKKRRIDGKVKVAKASTDKKIFERKMKIEKEREAARLALEKVEVSIHIDDFNQTYKEFLMLIYSQATGIK